MNADRGDKRDARTYAMIGACMEVHREVGHGFLEAVYQEALAKELAARGIPFAREVALPVHYKGAKLECFYKADFVCFSEVILEAKALDKLAGTEEAQIINYLKATGLSVGLLVNFGARSLEYKRFVLSRNLRESAEPACRTGRSADESH